MLTKGRVLFQGDCEIDQLFRIFEVLGVPTEESWPGVTQLEFFSNKFPRFRGLTLARHLAQLNGDID